MRITFFFQIHVRTDRIYAVMCGAAPLAPLPKMLWSWFCSWSEHVCVKLKMSELFRRAPGLSLWLHLKQRISDGKGLVTLRHGNQENGETCSGCVWLHPELRQELTWQKSTFVGTDLCWMLLVCVKTTLQNVAWWVRCRLWILREAIAAKPTELKTKDRSSRGRCKRTDP